MAQPNVSRGQVVHFSDGQRVHTALILGVSEDGRDAWALFLTSKPDWNKRARALTGEELAHFGFPEKSDLTYFAPVIRPASDIHETDLFYPEPRVDDLVREFGPSPFLPPVFTLPNDIYPQLRNIRAEMPKLSFLDLFNREVNKLDNQARNKFDQVFKEFDSGRFVKFVRGEILLPRQDLKRVVSLIPGLESFFIRRASITIPVQAAWEVSGRVLNEYRESQKIPRPLLAARLGIPDHDVMAFEAGIQCPSYSEMLAIQAFVPGIPEEWSLPTSTPLLADVIFMRFTRMKWKFNVLSSKTRISQERIREILVGLERPSHVELKHLSNVLGPLPPWRPWTEAIDYVEDKTSYTNQLLSK